MIPYFPRERRVASPVSRHSHIMAPRVGFDPTTYALTARRSAN